MMNVFQTAASAPGAYYAFQVSDGMGQGIVILLLFASVITWALMIDKLYSLFKAKRLSDEFLTAFSKDKRGLCSMTQSAMTDPSPLAVIYLAAVEKVQEYDATRASAKLTEEQTNAIEAVIEREISHKIMELEAGVSFLATIVSVCPFLGLFGTVWGVMLAFVGMAQQGSADIAAMAPGIASALLTTVVGLIVAIPSVVGYNLITSTIKRVIVFMDNFSEGFMVKLKLEQINRGE